MAVFAVPNRPANVTAHDTLWEHLRDRQAGWNFQRNAVVAGENVDFFAAELPLAVLLVGHAAPPLARFEREAWFGAHGLPLLSLSANAVLSDPWGAVARIRRAALRLATKKGPP